MNFEGFKESLQTQPINIQVGFLPEISNKNLDNEALFQLPFIAMSILVMAKGLVKPSVPELGRLVGECIELSMPAFKKSNQHIGWSSNLRVRTVNAISFLEVSGLIEVCNRRRKISITILGKKVISRALEDDTDLAHNLNNISRQFRNISKANKMELKLA
jgi:hypothetical protein